jgi:hypothetical protein
VALHELTVRYFDSPGGTQVGVLTIGGYETLTDWPGFANTWWSDGLANADQWAYLTSLVGDEFDDTVTDPGDVDLTGAPPEVVLPPDPWTAREVRFTSATPSDFAASQAALDALAGGNGTGLIAVAEGMAAALGSLKAELPDLQVTAFLNPNPTPPSLDIYPADLFEGPSGFGPQMATFWTVRARTTTADSESGQRALLRLLDRGDAASVEEALTVDQSLGGLVQAIAVTPEGVSGYRVYLEDPQGNGSLIGCEWRLEVQTK